MNGQDAQLSSDEAVDDIWAAPSTFTLGIEPERSEFLKAMSLLRHKVGKLAENITLDFSHTEKLYADGMLLFWAELKRLIKHVQGKVDISLVLPNNRKVAQVLKQIGILDLLGVKANVIPEDHDVINWRAATGNLVQGDQYEVILKEYDGEIAEYLQDNLYTGITEAMTNVSNHAYDLPREDGLGICHQKTWWMFSHQKDGYLSVAFCDLGAGIPRTLPVKRKSVWNRIMRKGIKYDSDIIKFAVKDSVSRTRKKHRGKGLRQIMDVIRGLPDAEAVVYSNKGRYGTSWGGRPHQRDYRDSILGTLIFWKIPLPRKEDV
ncbi:hypothetical protein [Herbaspirillum sp. C7C8]|uniref:hypothetical protein n=1 Tax=Herbaspirillum sp. C7C8 TaxID=2736665 RepID=UPI001F52A9B7|nr:hypothetical protein [Herbaspirillum sp. C7C8]MCI1005193.1 hypothetical protein [Herbaspirillum sp. C7C8]